MLETEETYSIYGPKTNTLDHKGFDAGFPRAFQLAFAAQFLRPVDVWPKDGQPDNYYSRTTDHRSYSRFERKWVLGFEAGYRGARGIDPQKAPTGNYCSVCAAPQFMTPGGIDCERKHGPVPPADMFYAKTGEKVK